MKTSKQFFLRGFSYMRDMENERERIVIYEVM